MSKLKQAFAKLRQKHTLSEFIGYGLGLTAGLALVTELTVMPFVMAPRLDKDLKEAVKADDGQKVEQVLNSHYSDHLWGWHDKNGNKKRRYMGERLCEATAAHAPAALDAILKNDPGPYDDIRSGSGSFIPVSHDYVYMNEAVRGCSIGQALKSGDARAADTFIRYGVQVGDNDGDLRSIGNSRELITYFLAHPQNLQAGDLLQALIKVKAPVENVEIAALGSKDKTGALALSISQETPEITKMLVQAGAHVNPVLQSLVRQNVNPYQEKGWDDSVAKAADANTRALLSMADQQRAYFDTLKKAPKP